MDQQTGLQTLGKLLSHYRSKSGLSMRDVRNLAQIRAKHKLGVSTISFVERGASQPTIETLSVLVQCGYIPYTVEQLSAIACGEMVPEPGELSYELETGLPKTATEAMPLLKSLPNSELVELAKLVLQSI